MFLTSKYFATFEYAKKAHINVSNFSNFYEDKKYRHLVGSELIKMGECFFIFKTFPGLTKIHAKRLVELELTDYSNKLPLTFLKSEYRFDPKFCEKAGYGKVIDVCGKKFFEFSPEFVKKYKNSTWYTMSKSELNEYLQEDRDAEYLQVSSKFYIIAY